MGEMAFMVIISDIGMEFEDRYRVYRDKDLAIAWAKRHGWIDPYGGFETKFGFANVRNGDFEIIILPVPIRD